jgi:hypothetical protein
MPFTIIDRAQARIPGDFEIQPTAGTVPSVEEVAYFGAKDAVLDALVGAEQDDTALTDQRAAARVQARRARRADAVAELRQDAVEFCAGRLDAPTARNRAWAFWGRYAAARDQLARSLFVVVEKFSDATNTFAVDLSITVAAGLPPPDDTPSKEKNDLYVAIERAATVVRTACRRMQESAEFWRNTNGQRRARRLLDEYTRKLAGIGRLGLQGPHTELAVLALNGLREEFVTAEAGRIKNSYIRGLGLMSGVAAVLILLLYAATDTGRITSPFWINHKPFLLAAAGAAVGTWLSFSIRRVKLAFDDLAVLEEDLLDPSVRVIFVIGLTLTACLLFWTGVMNIEIGNLKTAKFVGAVAFLIGIFSGLSERALATAISGRAAAFVKGIAGA